MQTHLLFVAAVEPYFQRYGRPLVSSLLVARKDCRHAETVVILLVYCFQHNTLFETLALLGNVFGYPSLGLGQPVRQQTCFLGHGCYNTPIAGLSMRIEEQCRQCNKTYTTGWPEGYQEFCSIGCRVDFYELVVAEYNQ